MEDTSGALEKQEEECKHLLESMHYKLSEELESVQKKADENKKEL